MEKERQNAIRNAFEKIGIALSERQVWQFERYYEILIQKNEVMNLTAITEFGEVVQKHFLDSLMIRRLMEPKAGERWLDLGTGAGFPGSARPRGSASLCTRPPKPGSSMCSGTPLHPVWSRDRPPLFLMCRIRSFPHTNPP